MPEATVDVSLYQKKRDLLCDARNAMEYKAPRPQVSFYVFPKTPILAFIRILQTEGILAVPGSGFGRGGYMALAYDRARSAGKSLPGFERALSNAR